MLLYYIINVTCLIIIALSLSQRETHAEHHLLPHFYLSYYYYVLYHSQREAHAGRIFSLPPCTPSSARLMSLALDPLLFIMYYYHYYYYYIHLSLTTPAPSSCWAARWTSQFLSVLLSYHASLHPQRQAHLFYHFYLVHLFHWASRWDTPFTAFILFNLFTLLAWASRWERHACIPYFYFIILYYLSHPACDPWWVYTTFILLYHIYYSMCL